MSDPRPFGLEDLQRQVAIGQVALDPAGELVAYTRRTIVDGRDRIDLWTVPYAGGEPRRLTDGPSSDTTPCFSPDGALIAYLIGTSDRFKAAVSENGVVNQIAAWANSDTGVIFNRAADLGEPTSPEGVQELWRKSPLRHVASIHTPLLMLQASDDLRCPAGDTELLFVALRWLGRPVAHVRYPEENHAFQGDGRFDRRLDRHRRVLEWFRRHMPA